MGVQFHPEFKSTPWDGHPLFNSYIKAALTNKGKVVDSTLIDTSTKQAPTHHSKATA